jgi:O-antigen/teichoic acid export membrane protein
MRKLLSQSSYARNVITLMAGTGMAQIIPLLISPMLTRLYTPEDFGMFAFYLAVVSIAAVPVTGRYELAIVLPKNDRNAIHIVALSLGLSFCVSFLMLLLIYFFDQEIVNLLNLPELDMWIYCVPLSTMLIGMYMSLNYWSNRKGHYRCLAISRVAQTGFGSVAQLSLAYFFAGPVGLVCGQLIGQFLAILLLLYSTHKENRKQYRSLNWSRAAGLARKYKNFPRIMVAGHALNAASGQMPLIILNTVFGAATAGFYTLVQRVLSMPMTLIASAIGDVFRQEASKKYASDGNCREVYVNSFKRLLIIAIVPFISLFSITPMLFTIIFGEPWRVAGEYAQILAPMFFMQFITSPLSPMFIIGQKQKLDFFWQIGLVVSVSLALLMGVIFSNIFMALSLFSASYCIMYAVNGILSYRIAIGR